VRVGTRNGLGCTRKLDLANTTRYSAINSSICSAFPLRRYPAQRVACVHPRNRLHPASTECSRIAQTNGRPQRSRDQNTAEYHRHTLASTKDQQIEEKNTGRRVEGDQRPSPGPPLCAFWCVVAAAGGRAGNTTAYGTVFSGIVLRQTIFIPFMCHAKVHTTRNF
jgi:hypothetical protein